MGENLIQRKQAFEPAYLFGDTVGPQDIADASACAHNPKHNAMGRKVLVNRHPMTVIGVAAQGFRGIDVGEVPSLWIPASMSAEAIPGFNDLLDRRTRWMQGEQSALTNTARRPASALELDADATGRFTRC